MVSAADSALLRLADKEFPTRLIVNAVDHQRTSSYKARMSSARWYDEVSLPALLRHARTTYAAAMREALSAAGYDDIPANGLYIIGGLALGAEVVPIRQLVKELGISKQGAGQLVDALVTRGYLARTPDKRDRRQLIVTLTERGRSAAAVQTQARVQVDDQLIASVGAEDVARSRCTLAALIDTGRRSSCADTAA